MLSVSSSSEKDFIKVGCESNTRFDGRGCADYRSITLETGIFPHTFGSSRVKISEVVDVLCSIKLEVEDAQDLEGLTPVLVNVDISPACRGNMEDVYFDEMEESVSNLMKRSINGCGAFPWENLKIIEGKYVWSIYVDILVLQMDGNPTDTCSLATFLAFQDLKVPKVQLVTGDKGYADTFEVVGDYSSSLQFDFSGVPIVVNVAKIGKALLVDSTASEISCAETIIYAGIDKHKCCCLFDVVHGGSINMEQLSQSLEAARNTVTGIFEVIQSHISSMQQQKEMDEADTPMFGLGLIV